MDNSNKFVLCFIDGEPHLYSKDIKQYIKLDLDYQATLDSLKNELKNVSKRPKMAEVWRILAIHIIKAEKYTANYNKRSDNKDLTNSFENKITRDISGVLDLKFARTTEEEKKARTAALAALKKEKESIYAGIRTMYKISSHIPKK